MHLIFLSIFMSVAVFATIAPTQQPSKLLELNDAQKSYLMHKKTLKVCVDPDAMPLEAFKNNQYLGIASDIVKEISQKIDIQIQIVPTESWSDSLQKIKNKQCDILMVQQKSVQKEEYLSFTSHYIQTPLALVAKQSIPFIDDLESIKHKRLGVLQNSDIQEMAASKYKDINLVPISSLQEGFALVEQEKIFGFLEKALLVNYAIKNQKIEGLGLTGSFRDRAQIRIASSIDEPLLHEILQIALTSIPQTQIEDILKKWEDSGVQAEIDYTLIAKILFLGIALLSIFIYWNLALQDEIKKRKNAQEKLSQKALEIEEKNTVMNLYLEIIDTYVLTTTTDRDGIIIKASQAYCNMLGLEQKEILGQKCNSTCYAEISDEYYQEILATLEENGIWTGEIKNKSKDGTIYWFFATISHSYDKLASKVGYTSIFQDITSQKRMQEISITDALTGIYNRRHFDAMLPKMIQGAQSANKLFCFMMLDIDHFKLYNDNYGHQMGDTALQQFSLALQKSMQGVDNLIFRLGGEEFAVIFYAQDNQEALLFANNVLDTIRSMKLAHEFSPVVPYLTVSAGLFFEEPQEISQEEVYPQTDALLYLAKKQGRNRIAYKNESSSSSSILT